MRTVVMDWVLDDDGDDGVDDGFVYESDGDSKDGCGSDGGSI